VFCDETVVGDLANDGGFEVVTLCYSENAFDVVGFDLEKHTFLGLTQQDFESVERFAQVDVVEAEAHAAVALCSHLRGSPRKTRSTEVTCRTCVLADFECRVYE
jgi:hypothetical protein